MLLQTAKSTEFRYHAPDASNIFLAGTFNDWQTEAAPMTKDDAGNWTTKLDLPPGRHEFKFVVDGEWRCEPNCHLSADCPKCVSNDFGTMNRFIDVE
jgi:5'-AMP-activated protein kinase regulatory beta subunit